ncbi:type II toxin-antitoxin system HicA family toxin [Kiloniella laminariae]|uniref:type II toxin-antitoxin system HicA family toxin n=1 Tax=Kiloniella laminariae TaxID=454162 RepID=UPI00036A380C|nr:type II toxin-antitoxin system HicA family toxin [Kiloniella laminariae]
MNSRQVIKLLKKEGWYHVKTAGDHFHFKHPTIKGKITVTHPIKDLSIGVIKNLERVTGLSLR